MKTKTVLFVVIFALGFIFGFLFGKQFYQNNTPIIDVQRDTVIVRDTVRLEVPVPINRFITRYDTIKVSIPTDSTKNDTTGLELGQNGEIAIAIEQKTYKTDDYKAVIEGWRPNLISMEVYPKITTIRETVTKLKAPRWSIIVGTGVGYDGNRITPYIGVTAGFVLWSK